MSDWKNMDQWYTVLPPSRPTNDELERIEQFLYTADRDKPVAILGSTPEFRDLLKRMGFHYRYVFDRSVDFYNRMGRLLPDSVPNGERFIDGDWLTTLPDYTDFFIAILSDLTMGNISYLDRDMFYTAIAEALVTGGTFIDKVLAFDFPVPSIKDLFKKYEKMPINLRTINDFSSEVLFCSELVTENNIVDSTKFYSRIREGSYSEKIKFFAEAAHMITPEGFLWSYGVKWEELSESYGRFYSSQRIYVEEDVKSPYYLRTKQFFNIK